MQQAFFSFTRKPVPDLSQLSDTEFAAWENHVARRQQTRSRVLRALEIGCMVAFGCVAVGMFAFIGSSLTWLVVAAPVGLGLMRGIIGLADQCISHDTSPDTARGNAENLRRHDLRAAQLRGTFRPRFSPPAPPATSPPPVLSAVSDDFAAALLKGVEKVVTVSRPLQLVKKPGPAMT